MDIHRPKAVHGWRELLREVGVIVLGVLIALAGEQAVEAIHWMHQADVGEAALKVAFMREVNNAALRDAQSTCIEQRLAALSSILERASDGGHLPPLGAVGHPPYTPWTIGAWEGLVAGQTVAHLPQHEMLAYTTIAQRAAYLGNRSDYEEEQWTLLDSMNGPGRKLSDAEAEALRLALARATDANRLMRATSRNLRDAIRETGLLDASIFADATAQAAKGKSEAAICRQGA